MTAFRLRRSPSEAVVIAAMAALLMAVIWAIVPNRNARIVLALFLAYEAWTLCNRFANDTLSEAIWQLSARPNVPFLFGCAFTWAVENDWLANPWLLAAVAYLMGHFFFQAQRETDKLQFAKVARRARTTNGPVDPEVISA